MIRKIDVGCLPGTFRKIDIMERIINEADERIDIVNESDQIIKTIWRSEVVGNGIPYMRIVLAPCVNKKGQICLLRRSLNKKIGPGHWSFAGGAVQHGEKYEEAFKREIKEEIGIDVSDVTWRYLGLIHPRDGSGLHFVAVYQVELEDHHLALNQEDFCALQWVCPTSNDIFSESKIFDQNAVAVLRRFFL